MAEPFEATPTNDVLDENRVLFRADFTDPKKAVSSAGRNTAARNGISLDADDESEGS